MAGLPKEVTDLAFNILSKLEQKDYNFFDNTEQLDIGFNKGKYSDQSHLEKTINLIKSIDINNVRPIEALQKLDDLQKKLGSKMMNKKDSFFKSFSLMSLITFFSRILGYIRDLFFAFLLGATPLADSFLLAFRIPNFFRRLFAEGAINNAFIPIYLSIENKKNNIEAQKFSGSIFFLILGLILYVFWESYLC